MVFNRCDRVVWWLDIYFISQNAKIAIRLRNCNDDDRNNDDDGEIKSVPYLM